MNKFPPDPKDTLYLVDISSFIFRAFYAIRNLSNRKGEPTNAVYGVVQMLSKVIDDAKPDFLAVVYDSKEPSFRKTVYKEYKANRSAPPDDLIPQFGRIDQVVASLQIPSFRQSGMEADDLIATLTKKWLQGSPDHTVVILTGDKDLMQLVDGRVKVWDTLVNKVYSEPEVIEKFGIQPEQIRDYLALVGDSSDNIPGVPSIGPKTATELLKDYHTLEAILQAAVQGQIPGKRGEVLKTHVKDAEISRELATLHDNLEVVCDRQKLKFEFHITPETTKLFQELDFHTLLKRWSAEGKSGAPDAPPPIGSLIPPDDGKFVTISTEKDLDVLIASIRGKGVFGFDVETTSLNPRAAELVGISLAYDEAHGYYIPLAHKDMSEPQLPKKLVLEKLGPLLTDPKIKKVGQNLKYDWSVMLYQGIVMDGIGADTMVAAYLLESENRHNLEAIARRYLDYQVLNYEDVCGKGKDQITFDAVPIKVATRYSGEDAWIALKLWNILSSKLHEEKMVEVFARVDLPLVPVLGRMETFGVAIDDAYLNTLSKEFEGEIKKIEERIQAYTKEPVNLNSPKQLAQLLFEDLKLPVQSKTKTGYSTDASVLEALSPLHEVPRLLMEYREISKLKGTYVDPLPLLKDAKTGRIHAGFHQTVAATGRLSSSDPNLQNIPIRTERGRKIRRAFIASPGWMLMSADYSQIELRLLAHMSGDVELTKSFQKDEDVHRRTASEIFGVEPESVTDDQRAIAKAINFGLMYGKTAFGLSQELKIPRKEAQAIIDRYFERYSGVKSFFQNQLAQVKEKGWTQTLLGRKRYLSDIHSKNAMVRANAERMALNAPLQGTAADLIKLAMIELDSRLKEEGFEGRLTIQVHDELLLDLPKMEEAGVKKILVDTMENAMKLSVPLRVNVAVGDNWMDL